MMEKRQEQEPLLESKEPLRESPRGIKVAGPAPLIQGARKWAAGIPLSELPEEELLELASTLGNSAMGALLGDRGGIETVAFSFGGSGEAPINKIRTAAPELTDPSDLGNAYAGQRPFVTGAMRDRVELSQNANLFDVNGMDGWGDFGGEF